MEPVGTKPRRPRIPEALAARIDQVRGEVPFDRWVRAALERALGSPDGVTTREPEVVGERRPTVPASARAPRSPSLERFR